MTMRGAGLLALCLLALPVQGQQRRPAQPPAPPAQPAAEARAEPDRAWQVTCADVPSGAPPNCRLSTNIVTRPQNQRIAQVLLTRQPETRSLGMIFQLPHGALIPAGVSWQVDEAPAQRLVFQTSDADGLYAGMPVADDLLAELRRGAALKLTFVVAAQRQAVTLPVPLAQFDAAATSFFAAERGAP